MASEDKFIPIYSGYEVNVQHLQNIFEGKGIDCFIRNDSESALRAGFGDATPGQVLLMVLESQKAEAERIIQETFPEQVGDEEV